MLDPLREAARNLRAPAAFWVLEGSRLLQVDVAGTPSVRPLSVESEKVLVTWLRTRPSVVFVDTLRPHLVRQSRDRAREVGLVFWRALELMRALEQLLPEAAHL